MSLSERLASGIGGLGEALFASGPNQYARGRLLSSRIGASDASRAYKQSQTRDLDYAHGNKSSLVDRFKAEAGLEGADPAIQMKLNALMSGEGMNDYTSGAINAQNFSGRQSALEEMKTAVDGEGNPLIDPITQLGLAMGQTGSDASMMSQRNQLTPGMISSEEAQATMRNASAANSNASATETGAKGKRNATTAEEFDAVMKKFKENPNAPLSGYESYVLNRGRNDKKVTGSDVTDAFTRGSDVKLAGKKVKLTDKKIKKIDEQIKLLGMNTEKSKALRDLYVAREEAVKSGKATGNVALTQAGSILKSLTTIKHRNSKGATGVRWGSLTKAEQEEIYFAAIDKAIKASAKLTGGSKVSDALNKEPAGPVDYSSQLQKHFNR